MADVELRLIANNEQYIAGIKESQQAFQGLNNAMTQGSKEQETSISAVVEGINKEIATLNKGEKATLLSGTSLRAELSKIRNELAIMDAAGLSGSKSFNELLNVANGLQKQLNDTSQQIKILASDTRNLDALMSVGEGLAGGFAIAQSASAMFGLSQEGVEEQLLKVQSALGMLNGIQAVADTLNKKSAASTMLAANAQKFYAFAVGTSSGAMKIFRLALIGTGIGALIVGLGLLIANWDTVSKAIKNNATKIMTYLKWIAPPIYLIIKAVQYVKDKFGDLQNMVAAVSAVISKMLKFDFKDLGKTFDETIAKEKEIDAEAKKYEDTKARTTKQSERNIKMLEAIGGKEQSILTLKKQQLQLDVDHLRYLINHGKNVEENRAKLGEANDEMALLNIEQNKLNEAVEKLNAENLEKVRKAFEDLAKSANSAKLNALTGKERIDAEEKIQLEEVAKLKKHLESIAKLNKEQYDQIDILILDVKQRASDARSEIDIKELEDKAKANKEKITAEEEYSSTILALENKIAEEQLDINYNSELATLKSTEGTEAAQLKLTEKYEKAKLELKKKGLEFDLLRLETENAVFQQITGMSNAQTDLQIESLKNNIKLVEQEINNIDLEKSAGKKKFSIWKLMGIDPDSEDGQKAIESLKTSTSIILDQIQQVMDAQLEQAEQNTQVIEDKLSEAESQLDEELELQKEGYANNVDAKKEEIAKLKIEKQKALKEEEKIKKQQLVLDAAMQASSLITATANIIKGYSSIPVIGPILAVIAIAAMWGTFAAAKVKAAQSIKSESKLEKGGHGTVNGRRHSAGGEKFGDHIEVESGERWGVLNRKASEKYGSLFPNMVDSMNSLKFPGMMIKAGNQTVNIDTKKMSSKLDSIDRGISVLNENMQNQADAYMVGKNRVVKVSKNHTRIIHATD